MDINDPKRIWNLDGTEELSIWRTASFECVSTTKGLAFSMEFGGKRFFSTHRHHNMNCPWWEDGSPDFDDVKPWPIPSGDFSEDEITIAVEFIQTG